MTESKPMTIDERACDYSDKWYLDNSLFDSITLTSAEDHVAEAFLAGYSAAESEIKKRDALIEKMVKVFELIKPEAELQARAIGASARRGDQSKADSFRFIRDQAQALITEVFAWKDERGK